MCFWISLFFINWFVNILIIEFFAIQKIKNIIKVDEERDQKFHAFRREDVKWFNRLWLFPFCHFMLLRITLCFATIGICMMTVNCILVGQKADEPMVGIRYKIVRAANYVVSRTTMLMASSCIWWNVERPKLCYKKWLGPDWVADYDGKRCGSIVSNHSSFLDAAVHSLRTSASFIAKKEVKDILFIGRYATLI